MKPRGGDKGGRRPKVLAAIIKKSYILEPANVAKIKAWARALGSSESEALRVILARTPEGPT